MKAETAGFRRRAAGKRPATGSRTETGPAALPAGRFPHQLAPSGAFSAARVTWPTALGAGGNLNVLATARKGAPKQRYSEPRRSAARNTVREVLPFSQCEAMGSLSRGFAAAHAVVPSFTRMLFFEIRFADASGRLARAVRRSSNEERIRQVSLRVSTSTLRVFAHLAIYIRGGLGWRHYSIRQSNTFIYSRRL